MGRDGSRLFLFFVVDGKLSYWNQNYFRTEAKTGEIKTKRTKMVFIKTCN